MFTGRWKGRSSPRRTSASVPPGTSRAPSSTSAWCVRSRGMVARRLSGMIDRPGPIARLRWLYARSFAAVWYPCTYDTCYTSWAQGGTGFVFLEPSLAQARELFLALVALGGRDLFTAATHTSRSAPACAHAPVEATGGGRGQALGLRSFVAGRIFHSSRSARVVLSELFWPTEQRGFC